MFDRLELLVGEKIEKLKNTTVLIIGLGGVGGYALESLVRSGIGKVIIIDNDNIDITNLNRQIVSSQKNIGLLKVDEWEKRILNINPNLMVEKVSEFITKENIDILFSKKFDFLIDACDTISTKKEIIRRCLSNKIQFISSMSAGKRFHPEKLEVTDVRKTCYDKIAKEIRKMVSSEKLKGKIPVVYSKEIPKKIDGKIIASSIFVPGVAGILCASYIFNLIVGE